jgi:hypothetical protein
MLAGAALALGGPAGAQTPEADLQRALILDLHRTPSIPGRVVRVEPVSSTAIVSTSRGDVRVDVPAPLRDTLRPGDPVELRVVMSPDVRHPQVGQGPTLPDGRAVYPGPDARTSVPSQPAEGWVRVDPPGSTPAAVATRPGCRQVERRIYENGQLIEQSVREVCS